MREALLAVGDDTTADVGGERLHVLRRAQITGFEVLDDAEYEPLRAWARLAKMPPYEVY